MGRLERGFGNPLRANTTLSNYSANAHEGPPSRGMTIPSLIAYEALFRTSGLSSIGSG